MSPAPASYQVSLRERCASNPGRYTVATALAPSELADRQLHLAGHGVRRLGQGARHQRRTATFRVDAVPPKVLKVKPRQAKAKSDLKVVFSEAVKGVSNKTVKLKPTPRARTSRQGQGEGQEGRQAGRINPKGR